VGAQDSSAAILAKPPLEANEKVTHQRGSSVESMGRCLTRVVGQAHVGSNRP